MKQVYLVQDAVVGYDLDDECTPGADGGACTMKGPFPEGVQGKIGDDDGGIDNAFKTMTSAIPLGGGALVAGTMNSGIQDGIFDVLVFLRGYNGQPNDDYVELGLLPAGEQTSAGCGNASAGGKVAPRFDGCDRWAHLPTLDLELGADGGSPRLTAAGTVTNDQLVVRFDRLAFAFGNTYAFPIDHGWFSARIVNGANGVELKDGVLSGRINGTDMLNAFFDFDLGGGFNACTFADTLQSTVCGLRDLPSDRSGSGRGRTCDAISMAITFEASPAQPLGSVQISPPRHCQDLGRSCSE